LGSEDLQVVLLHELAHIKRGDLWVNLAQTLLQIVYFYNPLLWLANAVIRRAREQAVDEAVLVAMGEKASRYPETLVSVAKLAFKRPTLSLRLIGVVESKSALTARIKRILSRPIPKSAKLGILGLAAIIITAAFILPMAQTQPYTDRAAKVMKLAEKEARGLNHAYIGTEHILLALAEQSDGVAAKVLDKLGIHKDALQVELKRLVKTGSETVTISRLPQTPRAKKALEHARNEARTLDHDYIGTEHILLGLMRQKDGVAAQMLAKLGVSYDVGRAEVLDFVKPGSAAKSVQPFIATLANGVTVELVGVCEHPSEGKQWWQPDGDELLEAPYDEIGGNVYPDGDEKSFEFAIRLMNLPTEHVNTNVRCKESVGGSAGGSSSPEKNGEYLSDFRWLATTFPKKLKACTVKVGVAAGQWQPVAQSNGKGFGNRGSELGGVSFTKAFEVEDGISITVADDILGRPCRVVAITNVGEVVKPVRSSGGSAGKARQTTAKFNNVSLSDIKEFQFQTRPYEWAEFKSVSLRPGFETDVEIEVGN